jgi:hypothetical protein
MCMLLNVDSPCGVASWPTALQPRAPSSERDGLRSASLQETGVYTAEQQHTQLCGVCYLVP